MSVSDNMYVGCQMRITFYFFFLTNLIELHPARLLLLLLDFMLLILLLTLFDGSRRGRSRRPLLRSSRRSDPAAAMAWAMAWAALRQPPSCRSLLRTKLVCDIPIAPFPRRTPPAKSFVSSKQASRLPHHLAWGTWPAQSHSNLTYTNAGGISEYLLFAPLVRRVPVRPGCPPNRGPKSLAVRGRSAARSA